MSPPLKGATHDCPSDGNSDFEFKVFTSTLEAAEPVYYLLFSLDVAGTLLLSHHCDDARNFQENAVRQPLILIGLKNDEP